MYRVEWLQTAMDELGHVWMQADSALRKAITVASHQIDKRLQSDPENVGESRPGNRRIEFIAPLAVIFQVDATNNTATVLHVRLYGKRKK